MVLQICFVDGTKQLRYKKFNIEAMTAKKNTKFDLKLQ